MSYEEMQKLEDVEGFFNAVNRGKDPAEVEAAEKVYNDYMDAQQKKEAPQEPERCVPSTGNPDYKAENRCHRRNRIRGFWLLVAEPAIGYIALGGVMVAAMIKGIVPAYIAIPVFSLCFIWTAIRADRFLREV